MDLIELLIIAEGVSQERREAHWREMEVDELLIVHLNACFNENNEIPSLARIRQEPMG